MMPDFVHVGDFCPNEDCSDYRRLQVDQSKKNIEKYGKTKKGRQRYHCKTCGKTLTETKGTIFYRRRTSEEEILETLAFAAESVRVSSLARVKGRKEDTILDWLRDAARHAQVIEEVLMADYHINRGQLDALWSYVGNKGEKKAMQRPTRVVSSGVPG
jgi:transposase-like protein